MGDSMGCFNLTDDASYFQKKSTRFDFVDILNTISRFSVSLSRYVLWCSMFLLTYQIVGAQDLDLTRLNDELSTALEHPDSISYLKVQTAESSFTNMELLVVAKAHRKLQQLSEAKKRVKKVQERTRSLVNYQLYTLNELGEIAIDEGQLDSGFLYFDQVSNHIEGLSAIQQEEAIHFVIKFYQEVGVLYGKSGEPIIAKRYFNRALLLNDQYEIKNAVTGDILMNFGILYDFGGNPDSAVYYYREALDIFKALSLDEKIISVYHNLGAMYGDLGKSDTAIRYLNQASNLLEKNPNLAYESGFNSIKLGRILLSQGKNGEAIASLRSSLPIVKDQFPYLEGEALELLKEAYASSGDYESAYQTSLLYDELVAELEQKNTEQIAQDIEGKYQNKIKAKEIAWLKERNDSKERAVRRLWFMVVGGIVIIILLFATVYFYRGQSRAQKLHNDQLEQLSADKTKFLAHIAHEVRTPITLISAPIIESQQALESGSPKKRESLSRSCPCPGAQTSLPYG